MSIGEYFTPPRLMISFTRPVSCRWPPAASRAVSPVSNQPSGVKASFDADAFSK